jgi:hypothetical protein
MRSASPIGWGIAAFAAMSIACLAPASGQGGSPGNSYYYVANTPPPDAFLDLRTHPSSEGLRIMTMPNGTLLEALERRTEVVVCPSGPLG